jgi:hypothetical protein
MGTFSNSLSILGAKLKHPEVAAYLSGLATPLSSTEINLLNNLVRSLKSGLGVTNLADHFDYFNIRAGETQEQSLRNLAKRAHDSTAVNSPTWTQGEGFTGNGTSSYIEVDYIPTNGVRYQLNDASHGLYLRVFNRGSGAKYNGVYSTTADGGNANRIIIGSFAATDLAVMLNDGGNLVSDNNTNGLYVLNRLSSSIINWFRNKAKSANISINSTKRPNQKIIELASRIDTGSVTQFGTHQISFSFCGKGLTDAQHSAVVDAMEAYMDAKGKGIIA